MTVKRALVVDDSKSARAFLARILERHDLLVDNAESAEQAIQYLAQQRPDVIFMDHLMPGMDGFQAVQAIKNDPRTATIPILMYTSQEGELYLSQARALGALGVLPKQTKPADVSKALYQLKLLPDRRTAGTDTTVVAPAIEPSQAPPVASDAVLSQADQLRALPPDVRVLIESLLRDHTAELRRFVVENLENNADRIVGDVRLMLKDSPAPVAPPPVAEPAPRRTLWIAAAAALLAVLLGALWYLAVENQRQLDTRLATLQSQLQLSQERMQAMNLAANEASLAAERQQSPLDVLSGRPLPAAAGAGSAGESEVQIEPVPFGEVPLAGARVERVQNLLERLMSLGFQGTVQIRSFAGRFCMTEAAGEPAAMASEQLPYAKCTQVGNPQDTMRSAQRESVAFANMLSAARQRASGTLDIQVSMGSADEVVNAYPAMTDALTAGEWNRAAMQNNRVELRWSPKPPVMSQPPNSG